MREAQMHEISIKRSHSGMIWQEGIQHVDTNANELDYTPCDVGCAEHFEAQCESLQQIESMKGLCVVEQVRLVHTTKLALHIF